MKLVIAISVIATMPVLVQASTALESDQPGGAAVFLKESEIYILKPGATEPQQLTSDRSHKDNVVLSKDGKHIAFLRETDLHVLGTISIIGSDGAKIRDILFRPEAAGVAGMRSIEHLEWISDSLIAVSGSVNPSTGEYAIVDAKSGKEVAWYAVEGYRWKPAPDGSHIAFVASTPHFTREEDRRPQFCLDDECPPGRPSKGYPGPAAHLEFTSDPQWSPDGSTVAITAEDYATKAGIIVVRPVQGRYKQYAAPPGTEGRFRISWDDGALVVHGPNGAWRLDRGSTLFTPLK